VNLANHVHKTLVGQISDKDWSRFNMYSRYVRVFKCRELQDAVGKDVYIQIARLHPKTLFPLLKEIEISTISDDFAENLGPLFHCLTPSLTSVTIRNIEGERGEMLATSFISALCCESIGLCDLSIDARISSEAVNCLDNIDGLRSLKLFMNSSITNIEKLIGLSAADLTVEFGRKGMVMKGHQRASNRLPLDIKALRVIGTNEQIDQVFDILELSFLEDIKLEILDPAATINPGPWRCIPPNLTALTIEAHIVKGKLPVISLRDLKLVDSSKLVTLSLKNLSLRATHDDFLDVFASGQGKNLRYLCLPYISDIDLPSSPSIEILGEIGHWCPKLLKLMIYVDLRLSDEKSIQKALKSMQTSSHGLMELNIQSIVPPKHNGFHQSVLLARYIDALFPVLEYLGAYDNLDENQKDYWAGIGEAVKWSHEMRRMSN